MMWRVVCGLLLLARTASAEVVRIDVLQRDDAGTHERVIARVHYAVDPSLPVNQAIADIAFAPRNAGGKVEFQGDLLLFLPKTPALARGTVFLEVVNRGREQSLALMSDARQRSLAPDAWSLGDGFLLTQGLPSRSSDGSSTSNAARAWRSKCHRLQSPEWFGRAPSPSGRADLEPRTR
jgi:hypothetical protein